MAGWSWLPFRSFGLFVSACLALAGLLWPWSVTAAPGDLDPNFVMGQVSERAIAVQPDGKILLGGNGLTRLLPSGASDTGFRATMSGSSTSEVVSSVAVQSDGRLLVGGAFTHGGAANRPGLVRLLSDGQYDSSFNARVGGRQLKVHSLHVDADEGILVGGDFETINEVACPGLARLRPDGTVDPGFVPAVSGTHFAVHAMARQEDGQWLVSRSYITPDSLTRFEVKRLHPNGSADPSFECHVDAPVDTIMVQHDQAILVGGSFTRVNDTPRAHLARLATDGTLDPTFAPSVGEPVGSLALQADGTLVVETTMETPLGALAGVHWVGAAGTRAGPFRPRDRIAQNLLLQHDGRLIAAGNSPNTAALPSPARIRLLNHPPIHTLEVLEGGRVRWARGVSAPGTQQTTVEVSDDDGRTYGPPVLGTRVQGGWEFSGLGNVSERRLRLRARISGGARNGSSSLAEWTTVVGTSRPSPQVHQPAGTLVNSAEGRRFPDTDVGGSANLMFTLLNTGTADLRLDAVVVVGPGASSFVLAAPLPGALPGPYGSATFAVSFRPRSAADLSANLVFYSPDPAIGSFSIPLAGRGLQPAPSGNSALSQLMLGSGVLTPAFEPNVLAYTASLPFSNSSLEVRAVRAHPGASVTVAGMPTNPPFPWTTTVSLEVGVNQIPVVVTAESGGQTTYTLTITRASQLGVGDIDTSFVMPPGTNIQAAVPLPGGQILVRGYFFAPDRASYSSFCVWLNPDGSLRRTLPPSVIAEPVGDGAVAVQRDGRILLTEQTRDPATGRYRLLRRVLADGSPDPSFLSPLASGGTVSAIAILPDDAILIAGRFANLGDEARSHLARLRPDGSLDVSFAPLVLGSASWDILESILLEPDGKIIIGGFFLTVNGIDRGKLARLNADGSLDETFRPFITSGRTVSAMVRQQDGKLIVGGYFSRVRQTASTSAERLSLARFHPDGSLDTGFWSPVGSSANSEGSVHTLTLDTFGRLYVGGDFSYVKGQARKNLARLLPDGSVDPTFAPAAGPEVRCLALEAGGSLLVAASDIFGLPTAGLVRLLNDPVTDRLSVDGAGRVDWIRGGAAPEVSAVLVEASGAPGSGFTPLGEASRTSQGWTWSGGPLPPGGQIRVQAPVRVGFGGGSLARITSTAPIGRPASSSLQISLHGAPVVSGGVLEFPIAEGQPVILRLHVRNAGEVAIPPLTVAIDGIDAAEFTVVRPLPALAAGTDAELEIQFSPLGVGQKSARLRLSAPSVEPMEFSLRAASVLSADTSLASLSVVDWLIQPALSPAATDYVSEVASFVSQVHLIAVPNHPGGRLRVDGRDVPDPSPGIAIPLAGDSATIVIEVTAQDGVSKASYRLMVHRRPDPLPGDFDPSFVAETSPTSFWKGVPQPDGGVLIQELLSNPTQTIRLRRLQPDGRADPGFLPYDVAGNFNSPLAVAILPEGEVLVGIIGLSGSGSSPGLVRLRKNGVPDPEFGLRPGIPVPASQLQCMAVQPDGGILLGGSFTHISGIARTSIARLNKDGVLDSSFNPVLAGFSTLNPANVTCIAVQSDGRILISGTFVRVDGINRSALARLEPDGGLDRTFQPVLRRTPFAIVFDSANRILAFTNSNGRHFNEYSRFAQDGSTEITRTFPPSSLVSSLPQADGRLVFGGLSDIIVGNHPTNLFRTDAAGVLDSTMQLRLPPMQSLSQLASFPDGRLLCVVFENIDGIQHRRLFRAMNGTVRESLMVVDSARVRWERQGNAPEAHFVTFALSTDGGSTFSDLGMASRIGAGWELAGLALPMTGHIRAHARYVAGPGNRDSSLVESVTPYSLVSGPRDTWRQRHFGTAANDGPAADWEDPDGDGLTNLVEFAGGSDPNRMSDAPLQPVDASTTTSLSLLFVRSREAIESGLSWVVEWSDSLSDAVRWSSAGVDYSVVAESAASQQVMARVPPGPLGRRFARLRIVSAPAPDG